MKSKILIRCDAGLNNGMGHLSRCSVLAKEFSNKNIVAHFLIRSDESRKVKEFLKDKDINDNAEYIPFDISPELDARVTVKKYKEIRADFLIIDHYRAGPVYQIVLEKGNCIWAQFDYKKSFKLIAQVVINPHATAIQDDYKTIVGNETILLLGPMYALIDEMFKNFNVKSIPVNKEELNILMIFGAGNDRGAFIKITGYLNEKIGKKKKIIFNWVTTSINPNLKGLIKMAHYDRNINLHIDATNQLPMLMFASDIAITSGGNTSFELAYLKKPMILIPFAENQFFLADAWQKLGVAFFVRNSNDISNLNWYTLNKIIYRANEVYQTNNIVPGNGSDIITNLIINNFISICK